MHQVEQFTYPLQLELIVKTYNYQTESCYSAIRMKLLLK